MMKRIFLFLLLVPCCGIFIPARGQQQAAPKTMRRDERLMREVRAVLDAQVEAWNRGDIEGFMSGYAQSPDTIFVSGDSVTRGWQTVLDRYKRGYDTREKMGTLTFSELEIKPLAKDMAVVVGRWALKRAGDEPKGRFTLILRRTRAGWRIIHDHTSSA
ncbi:MAG: nuclear transport factor 2 family protein [Acidobacteria bacterium]|nr:nuclear transport factor 2 family protein [Acidobacteriota bacterium]